MNSESEFVVWGNSVGAMVSALELARHNRSVILVNTGGRWGGHFGGIKIQDHRLDLGMNYFEFTSFNADMSADIRSYDPRKKNDSGRFVDQVRAFVTSRVVCEEVVSPQMRIENKLLPDLTISNRIDSLRHLSREVSDKIRSELEVIVRGPKSPLHASNKNLNLELFAKANYEEASLANHGRTFHDLFVEPLCRKILNIPSSSIPAQLHRVAWGPLFYPETILSQLGPSPQALPTTRFCASTGGTAMFVDALASEIEASKNIRVSHVPIEVKKSKLIWGAEPDAYLKWLGRTTDISFEKSGLAVVYTKASVAFPFSTIFDLQPTSLAYRITSHGRGILSAEVSLDRLSPSDRTPEAISRVVADELRFSGSIVPKCEFEWLESKMLGHALKQPTFENVARHESIMSEAVRWGSDVEFIGPGAAYSATSLNDGIVQGLKVGEIYGRD